MKKIVCYGAGNFARKGLPVLIRQFTIPYIIDCDRKKHGEKLYNIEILPVSIETVNYYPIIMVEDIQGVLETLYGEMQCNVPIYRYIKYTGGMLL